MLDNLPMEYNRANRIYPENKYPNNIGGFKLYFGLSNKSFGQKVGICYSTIAAYDRGERPIRPEHKKMIEDTFGYEVQLYYANQYSKCVVIPAKELEIKMSKVFNILLLLEDIASGECEPSCIKELQGQQGFDITARQLGDYFKQFGLDVE